jgi:hypothetical protein
VFGFLVIMQLRFPLGNCYYRSLGSGVFFRRINDVLVPLSIGFWWIELNSFSLLIRISGAEI